MHIKADSGVNQREGDVTIQILKGNVRVVRGTTTILSDRARKSGPRGAERVFFYENVRITDRHVTMTGDLAEYQAGPDWAEMQEHVVIQDTTAVIHAQRARYYRQQRVMWLWGNVEFTDQTTRVLADSVRFDEASGLGEAFGNVVLQDLEGGSEAHGPHGFYDRRSGDSWLDPEPMLVLHDKDGTETRIFAREEARMNKQRGSARVRGNVRIERGDMVAQADSAFLYDTQRLLELRGNPRVSQKDARISGRDIDVFFGAGDTIERVVVRRNARMVQTRPDTLLIPDDNVVRGDSATIYFADGAIQRAVVSGRASSTFVPEESRPNRIALNEAQSDSIIVVFEKDEIQEVIFLGNATGTYRSYEGDLEALRAPPAASIDTTFGVVRGDTTRFDFRREAETVEYKAERILYMTTINDLHLQDAAEVRYQGRTLQAGNVRYDADTDLLVAHDNPVLIEGGDRIYGEEMGYDMAKRDSWVESGSTEYDQGYYHGKRILRAPDGTLYVENGEYTTCDLAEAHYGFHSKQMKIYMHDKAIGRPVVLYLGKIPVGYLPFFFSSTSTDRHSGFLQPTVEIGLGTRSRYIHGLDYYWAASNYWDVKFTSDYSERDRVDRTSVGSVLADTSASRNVHLGAFLRYKVRYKLDGNINYLQSYDLDSGNKLFTVRGDHHHDLSRNTNLSATLDYASSDAAVRRNYVNTDYDRSRQRQLNSALTFNHRADLGNVNLSLTRRQIVAPDESFINGASILHWTQPSGSVTFRSIRLAPRPHNPRDASFLQRFFSELQFAPNLRFNREVDTFRRRRFLDANTGVVVPDTTGIADSLLVEDIYEETLESLGGSTSIGLGRQANLWIFNVTPSVGYSGSYARSEGSSDPELRDGKFTHSFNAGVGGATRFYGIFKPGFGRLSALRHTIEPRANYSYAIASGQSESRQFVTWSLANRLDVKYEHDGKEVRQDGVVDWSLSGNYNPQADDHKWSTISSRLTLNRQGPLRLDVTQTYDPYTGKITETNIPFQVRLSGKLPSYEPHAPPERLNRVAEEEGLTAAETDSAGPTDKWGFQPDLQQPLTGVETIGLNQGGGPLGWDLSTSYSLRRKDGKTQRVNVSVAVGLQPTRNWRVRYGAYYDVASHELTNPAIRIERDLHCWTASFARVYSGFDGEWRYYFRIYVKKHQEDLFFESGNRSFGS